MEPAYEVFTHYGVLSAIQKAIEIDQDIGFPEPNMFTTKAFKEAVNTKLNIGLYESDKRDQYEELLKEHRRVVRVKTTKGDCWLLLPEELWRLN
jgi:hypothetical protein